ncbi:hypothetical protein ACOSP7_000728 [Xanthoceras sorbifolium]
MNEVSGSKGGSCVSFIYLPASWYSMTKAFCIAFVMELKYGGKKPSGSSSGSRGYWSTSILLNFFPLKGHAFCCYEIQYSFINRKVQLCLRSAAKLECLCTCYGDSI